MYGVTEIVVNSLPVVTSSITEPGWRTLHGGGGKSTAGIEVNELTAMGYAPFWRAVNLIASDVAGMSCDIFKRQRDGGKKYASEHPAAALLRDKPSAWWSARTMIETGTYHANVFGNAYLPIVRDMNENPVEIGLADPAGMMIKVMDDGQKWYIWHIRGQPVRVPDRDMIHIKGLSRDGIIGLCQLDLFRNALGVGMAAQEFGGRLFSQGANMSGLLMVPGHFSEEKIRNTMSAWNEMQTGLNKSHRVALLQDGVKFQPMSIDPDKAQFLGTREFEVRQTVSNITGVPPHMLGDATRTSHNSLESESQTYLSRCLNPWLKRWEAELRAKLMTPKERMKETHVIEFNRESEVQMEGEKKVNMLYRQIESGMMTRNEARSLMNMPRITDEEQGGDDYYHPANWMVAGEEPDADEAMGADPMQPDETEEETEAPEEARASSLLRAMVTSAVTEDIRIECSRVVQRAGMRTESDFQSSINEFYETWTKSTVPELTQSAARTAVISHAEASKKLLFDVHAVSTVGSLKANVQDVVASWDARAENLITELMKAVQ
jgi:HK97 family phage portal protein